jgi:tetratricopeptide (TPR) repeat protein
MPESHLLSAWARAWLEYRYGDPKKGLEIVGAHGGWFPHWLPRALLLEKLGRSEEARDWFMAWYEWAETACYPAQLPFVALTAELGEKAAAVLKQPLPPPSEKSPASYLRLYDSLLKRTPDDPALVLRHGACHARLGQWKAAANDFAFAAKHTHHELPRLDLAFALFELGDLEGCRSAWRLSADRMLTTRNVQDVSTLLTLHSLAPDAGFDPQVLLAISEQIPTFDATDDDAAIGASVCRGIALYSCGRDREAIELLVDGGRRRDLVLAQAFRAMAYHRLGDSVKAREALAQARRTIALRDAKRPIPDCEYIFDRYLLDCRLQRVVLRAEQLIEPSAKAADANK